MIASRSKPMVQYFICLRAAELYRMLKQYTCSPKHRKCTFRMIKNKGINTNTQIKTIPEFTLFFSDVTWSSLEDSILLAVFDDSFTA